MTIRLLSKLYSTSKRASLFTTLLVASTTLHALPKDSIAYIAVQQWTVDHAFPWRIDNIVSGTGSGVYLGNGQFLTNAHVVQNPQRIQILSENAQHELSAELTFISEESDLAIITTPPQEADKIFSPIRLGKKAETGDEVTAIGFPGGLLSIATTKGVISRIYDDSYAHTGRTLPIIQMDAAVNGGASGGALTINNKLVGIVSQNAPDLQSVGHAIPLPVLHQFIADTKDGKVDGLPDLGIQTRPVTNSSKRNYYGLREDQHALEINEVSGFARANGLQEGDLILEYNESPLNRYGSISNNSQLDITTAVALSQIGDSISLKILRDRKPLTVDITLSKTWSDHFLVPIDKNERPPSWVNFGGIIIVEMNDGYLTNKEEYPSYFDMLSSAYVENHDCRSGAVIISNILPHPANNSYSLWIDERITKVNGEKVRNIDHLNFLINTAKSDWIELVTWPYHGIITMSKEDMLKANADLQGDWEIGSNSNSEPPSSLAEACH